MELYKADSDAGRVASFERAEAGVPPVSVVVAVYNIEKYLCQCLDSLVNQTLDGVEIIVVNDASTDGSADIISEYAAKYSNVRAINCEKNRGLATVRNIGMAAAKGKYIAFADGDDWVDVRMCEAMYRRANADGADVLIADATVFYDDVKTFAPFFDQHIRTMLDEELRTRPFNLAEDFRVLLVEPVAWTKLYRRSFLLEHGITFEDGMNSYEDICFHFSVLLRANRLSLTDEAFAFYRQNRPGQISARTNRKIFEVFDVFDKIHRALTTMDAAADAWAMLIRVELRQFDWLLKDRVHNQHKAEFIRRVAAQFGMFPKAGIRAFARHATVEELSRFSCMKRGWGSLYERARRKPWLRFPLAYLELGDRRPGAFTEGVRRGLHELRRRSSSGFRKRSGDSSSLTLLEGRIQTLDSSVQKAASAALFASAGDESLTRPYEIQGRTFLFSEPSAQSGVGDAVWRMRSDYYLTRAASFRAGDVVVDVGAHVGVLSIYLAKTYPFLKVYSIEPDPLNFACLKRNIEVNDVPNVIAINKGVSLDGRDRTLYLDALNNGWATIDAKAAARKTLLRTVQVGTLTLEQLFRDQNIRHCRLLKITAPGAVAECLDGLTRSNCVDLLCGEVELKDCSRVKLEAASWRIARQHFWWRAEAPATSWLHQMPTCIERSPVASRLQPYLQTAGVPVG